MIQLVASGKFGFVSRLDRPSWLLREGEKGRVDIPVRQPPFIIGRAPDCQLVLPESPALAKVTSRWHCHIVEEQGEWILMDGSFQVMPNTGLRKPSITGTFVNGQRLSVLQRLKSGDIIAVGPWHFRVEPFLDASVDIDGLLEKLDAKETRVLEGADPRLGRGFGRLQGLFERLNEAPGTEECLEAILDFALKEIPGAEIAAILSGHPQGNPTVRAARRRGAERIHDLQFSSGLLRKLTTGTAFLLQASGGVPTKSQLGNKISSGLAVPLRGNRLQLGILYMDNRNRGGTLTEDDLFLANALASVASLQLVLEREVFLSRIAQNMRQYFGPDVVRLIVQESREGRQVGLGVKEYEATILFVDLVGFSEFCRTRGPQDVGKVLNSYYELMAGCIQDAGGHVDKFIGDGVMGVFGVHPVKGAESDPPNHACQAVRAAEAMIAAWAERSLSLGDSHLHMRIGIDTGKVLGGNIGFAGRMEYSVLGDPANRASRMEKLAGHNRIAMTDDTHRLVQHECACEELGEVEVKGFGKVKAWLLAPRVSGPP